MAQTHILTQVQEHTVAILQRVESGGMPAVQKTFLDFLEQKSLQTIATPNPEHLVLSAENTVFWQALQDANYMIPDGVGLIAAYWWHRFKQMDTVLPQGMSRVGGREVVEWWLHHNMTHVDTQQVHKTLLLGSRDGVAERLAQQVDPDGAWCAGIMGYSRVKNLWEKKVDSQTKEEHTYVMEFISQWKPEVIFVAFGAPQQELWMQHYRKDLEKAGVKIVMVCGGAFDVLTGDASAAPQIIASMGLEWLWRLITEPWRWRRQLRLITFLRGNLQ